MSDFERQQAIMLAYKPDDACKLYGDPTCGDPEPLAPAGKPPRVHGSWFWTWAVYTLLSQLLINGTLVPSWWAVLSGAFVALGFAFVGGVGRGGRKRFAGARRQLGTLAGPAEDPSKALGRHLMPRGPLYEPVDFRSSKKRLRK